jgi:hypothetical protein
MMIPLSSSFSLSEADGFTSSPRNNTNLVSKRTFIQQIETTGTNIPLLCLCSPPAHNSPASTIRFLFCLQTASIEQHTYLDSSKLPKLAGPPSQSLMDSLWTDFATHLQIPFILVILQPVGKFLPIGVPGNRIKIKIPQSFCVISTLL